MTTTIQYRPYNNADIRQIQTLWESSSDFGGLTDKQFNAWFLKTPYEEVEIIVGGDEEGKLIGQMNFLPSRMIINGRLIKAMKIAAPILDANYRFTGLHDHPIYNMFLKGVDEARKKGFSVFYIFPARGWLRALEMFSGLDLKWHTDTYNTFAVSLAGPLPIENEFSFNKVEGFTEEYDELWRQAVLQFPVTCGIERNKKWLSYRIGHHCIIEARDKKDNTLKGYMAVKKDSGLMVDLLAGTKEQTKKIFWGAAAKMACLQQEEKFIKSGKITGMHTGLMDFVLHGREAEFPNYKFDFGCCSLDNSIHPEDLKPTNWYMMPDV
jgi:hypothetical protein